MTATVLFHCFVLLRRFFCLFGKSVRLFVLNGIRGVYVVCENLRYLRASFLVQACPDSSLLSENQDANLKRKVIQCILKINQTIRNL